MTRVHRQNGLIKIRIIYILLMVSFGVYSEGILAQAGLDTNLLLSVGIASGDITPNIPIRLGGYGARSKMETSSIYHELEVKALTIGKKSEDPVVFITLDLVGLSDYMAKNIRDGVKRKFKLADEQIAISVSHTHGAPEVGNIINILQYRSDGFSDSLMIVEELIHIARYNEQVVKAVLETVDEAFNDGSPSIVAWGQGQVGFAKNRRTEGGPVDPALPILRITSPDGNLRGVLLNYACHGTTLPGDINQVHGDWISEAKLNIEKKHPGAKAMVAIGCGGDANPFPRGDIDNMKNHGIEIANQVDRLIGGQLDTLTSVPVAEMVYVELPFEKVPSLEELMETAESDQTIKGYYSRLALERHMRGYEIPESILYPVQVWAFGDKMLMINLAGEVVVDYSIRLKDMYGAESLWVNGYMNEVPCYIASKRVIQEGGYEAESSMYYYDKPSPFSPQIEDIIIDGVKGIMPDEFKKYREEKNQLKRIRADRDGNFQLKASDAEGKGPNIKYMPEWRAFGWFNVEDQAEWQIDVEYPGDYQVFLEWSVDDARSGKSFIFGTDNNFISGNIGKTGSWFTFRKEMIGTIALESGVNTLIFRSGDITEKGAMLDLREIKLKPVHKN